MSDHDRQVYLSEDRRAEPKEIFKELFRRTQGLPDGTSWLDFGCATGDFQFYLASQRPEWHLVGIDTDQEMIQTARSRKSKEHVSFWCGSILEPEKLPYLLPAHVVSMIGVHGYFDLRVALPTLIQHALRKWPYDRNTQIFIMGRFNPEPFDVFVQYQIHGQGKYLRGQNIPSIATISKWLDERQFQYSFTEFRTTEPLVRREDDLLRGWTVSVDGRHALTNGLGLLFHQYILEISVHLDYHGHPGVALV